MAAASDLRFALPEIVARFQQHNPGAQVMVSYGSSGNFYGQLTNHAPFDVFLSADVSYPRQLIEAGMAPRDSEFVYAIGYIVVWVPQSSPLDLNKLSLRAVLDPAVKKVAIANPQHAPYGRAAKAALKSAGVYDEVKERLVLGDTVAQAAQFVESGAADVAIIALSLAAAPAMQDKGRYWKIPDDAYPRLEQGGLVLNWAHDAATAAALRSFLLGDEARAILRTFGFGLPGE